MTKNNRKKDVAQAISTAVALCWAIMQVESAQAATLTVNNLNDSGVGSLRDTINMATSNDVVDFLLGTHPSTITLTSGAIAMPAVVTELVEVRATPTLRILLLMGQVLTYLPSVATINSQCLTLAPRMLHFLD